MYLIYMDEAGTSANEPVSVVTGVIVQADTQWTSAARHLKASIEQFVPSDLHEGFIFHAKTVWNGYRDRDDWNMTQRQKFVAEVASIPRKIGAAISLGKCRRDSHHDPEWDRFAKRHEFQHLMAFHSCLGQANHYIRIYAAPNELASVIAEDEPNLRNVLRKTLKVPFPELDSTLLRRTKLQEATGEELKTISLGTIDRVIDSIHFVEKDGAPLLQLADACAFSFRRYFAGQRGGGDLIRRMLGSELIWEDWQGPWSSGKFFKMPVD